MILKVFSNHKDSMILFYDSMYLGTHLQTFNRVLLSAAYHFSFLFWLGGKITIIFNMVKFKILNGISGHAVCCGIYSVFVHTSAYTPVSVFMHITIYRYVLSHGCCLHLMPFATTLVQHVLQKFHSCKYIKVFPLMYACDMYVSGSSTNLLIKEKLQ